MTRQSSVKTEKYLLTHCLGVLFLPQQTSKPKVKNMKKPFSFECINCNQVVTEKFSPIMLEVVKSGGACCNACCAVADSYYASPIYQAFEEAEENFDYYA